MAYIACKDLVVGYDGRTVAENINFSISKGDYLCIIGENGAGKSTLMKTLLGLEKPVRGEMILGDGLELSDIGYLPQSSEHQLDFPASVYEIVMSGMLSGMKRRSFFGRKEKEAVLAILERMEIMDLKNVSFKNLSGGQKQKVLLARTLCAPRKLILLDEPVTGLDVKATADLYSLIEKLNKEGMAVVMISHDHEEVKKYATHILHLGRENSVFEVIEREEADA